MQIRLTEAEYEAIERKFRNSGLKSRSEFIRAMIFEGYIVHFDEEKFDKIYKLIGNISNNVNQIAVRVNSTDKIYAEDSEVFDSKAFHYTLEITATNAWQYRLPETGGDDGLKILPFAMMFLTAPIIFTFKSEKNRRITE